MRMYVYFLVCEMCVRVKIDNPFSLMQDFEECGVGIVELNKMEVANRTETQSFSVFQVENDAIYACRHCYADIFLERNILYYVASDGAFFVKQKESLNFSQGYYTKINCSNCKSYLGRIVYNDHDDNQLRLTETIPKYTFR